MTVTDWISTSIAAMQSAFGRLGLTLEHAVATVLVLATITLCSRLAKRAVTKLLSRHRRRLRLDHDLIHASRRWIGVVVWIIGLLILLDLWGVQVSGLWATFVGALSVAGVALLATWAIASNVTAGSFLSMSRPFHLGETIEILPEEVSGRVVDRTMFFTVIVEADGAVTHVPNNLIFQRIVRCRAETGRPDYDETLRQFDEDSGWTSKRSEGS